MAESEKQFETKEQPKTKIVNIQYGSYEKLFEIVEVPADWDMNELLEQFKKETNYSKDDVMDDMEIGSDFSKWLIKKGAKKPNVSIYEEIQL